MRVGLFGMLRKPQMVTTARHEQAAVDACTPVPPQPSLPDFLKLLVTEGLLDGVSEGRAAAALRQTPSGTDCSILTELGMIEEQALVEALATFHGTIPADAAVIPRPLLAVDHVPPGFWERTRMLPVRQTGSGLVVAMVDPFDHEKRDSLSHAVDRPVEVTIIGASAFEGVLRSTAAEDAPIDDLAHGVTDAERDDLARLQDVASQAPIIRLGSRLLKTAFELNASDMHLEPQENDLRVRYRVDGVLVQSDVLPKAVQMALTTRFKILAGLNIAELRMPQDGRMKVVDRGVAIDLRVAALPTANGEALVMRILRQTRKVGTLTSLGFTDQAAAQITSMIGRPNGIVLVSGPTGSGKTTTLYTAVSLLNEPDRKIITVEDPVEYRIAGVSQVQTHAQIGLDFAAALRSILRQDPDIVMIGEIRDQETARIAVQAALTGHLVLSTIHTNSAAATVTRLVEMGIEPYLIAATLNGVIAQRLVRLVCPHCADDATLQTDRHGNLWPDEGGLRGLTMIPAVTACGCPQCNQTGFKGRTVVGEVMTVDASLRDLIVDHAHAATIEAHAVEHGMTTLAGAARQKIVDKLTTLDEVLRHVDLQQGRSAAAAA